jgi:hypothetical protein
MALQVSKNIQALADAAEEKRRQQEQGFDPSVAGLGLGGGVRGKPDWRTGIYFIKAFTICATSSCC